MRELLRQVSEAGRRNALTHPAYAESPESSFERLEFLGDSVLGLAISAALFRRFPTSAEGVLSKLKASVVSRETCAIVAREHGLGEEMLAAAPTHADARLVAELAAHDRVLAALVESVIGVAFIELGYEAVAPVIVASFTDRIGHALDNHTDAKSELQELAQRRGETVTYRVVSIEGPDHDRQFTMQARLDAAGLEAVGVGRTKKAAEQVAARRLLASLKEG